MPSSRSSSSYDGQVEDAIPNGTIYMFAGAEDSQQACDVSNVKGFELPDPAGRSGGACTSALLQTLWRDEEDDNIRYSWAETLELMRDKIEEIGLTQVPQLSTSRPIDVNEEICITNASQYDDEYDEDDDEYDGYGSGSSTKRAMLVGVNYTGEDNALTSCHNDVRNMKDFLVGVHGFDRSNMLVLMDDGQHHEPTKDLIMDGFKRLCEISQPGDSIFIQFSGHGGQMPDRNGDEEDGMDEILIPGDYKESGQIVDDEIYAEFVTQVPAGVHVVCMIDCCHSGTAMDLPYVCSVGDDELRRSEGFKPIPPGGAVLTPKKKTTGKKEKGKKDKGKKDKEKDKKPTAAAAKGKKKKKGPKKKVAAKEESDHDEDDDVDEEEYDDGSDEPEEAPKKEKKKGLLGRFGGKGKKSKA